jgi:hypothetical protein
MNSALVTGDCSPIVTQTGANMVGLGSETITLTATNTDGDSVSCTFDVTGVDYESPSITCPSSTFEWSVGDECTYGLTDCGPAVTTSDNCGSVVVSQNPPSGTQLELGSNVITMIATDGSGNYATCNINALVSDNTAPVIYESTTDQTELWPPNHKWDYVELYLNASDNCAGDMDFGTLTCNVTSISLDEIPKWDATAKRPKSAHCGLGHATYEIIDDLMVKLCRERNDDGVDGRTYTLSGNCHDDEGNWTPYSSDVLVPHSQGN